MGRKDARAIEIELRAQQEALCPLQPRLELGTTARVLVDGESALIDGKRLALLGLAHLVDLGFGSDLALGELLGAFDFPPAELEQHFLALQGADVVPVPLTFVFDLRLDIRDLSGPLRVQQLRLAVVEDHHDLAGLDVLTLEHVHRLHVCGDRGRYVGDPRRAHPPVQAQLGRHGVRFDRHHVDDPSPLPRLDRLAMGLAVDERHQAAGTDQKNEKWQDPPHCCCFLVAFYPGKAAPSLAAPRARAHRYE